VRGLTEYTIERTNSPRVFW